MDTNPLVSVIIPTRNRLDFLKNAIQSVRLQTYTNIELIVVDDGSNDETEKFCRNQDKLCYIRNEVSRGAPYCRNIGFQNSRGKYINFLDDDDEFFPDKISDQVNFYLMNKDEPLVLVTCHMDDGRSGQTITVKNKVRGNLYRQLLTSYCLSGTPTMLIDRSAFEKLGGFDEKLVANQEYDLSIRLAQLGNFDYVDKILCRANRSVGQIHTDFKRKLIGSGQIYKKYFQTWWRFGIKVFLHNQVRFGYLFSLYSLSIVFGEAFYRKTQRKNTIQTNR